MKQNRKTRVDTSGSSSNKNNRALIVVDVQNDFVEGGALGCIGGTKLAQQLISVIPQYRHVVATLDWHIDPGNHFSTQPDFQNTWPVHCRAHTVSAQLASPLHEDMFCSVFRKGEYSASYSGFDGKNKTQSLLADWLDAHLIRFVDIVGIAADFCVFATACDAKACGFTPRIMSSLTVGTTPESKQRTEQRCAEVGIEWHVPAM